MNDERWNALQEPEREVLHIVAKSLDCSEKEVPDELNYQYWELRKSIQDIAEATNVPYKTISSLMKKFNIPTRMCSTKKRLNLTDQELADQLWHMYIEKKMNQNEIAIQLQVAPSTVNRLLSKYQIRFRKKMMEKDKWDTVLCDLYLKKQWDIPQIADELNVSFRTIEKWLNRLGIPRHSKRRRNYRFSDERLLSTIYQLYWKRGMSLEQTAHELNVSILQVCRWMEKLNIPFRNGERSTN